MEIEGVKVEKPKMVSLKEQLVLNRNRLVNKVMKRRMKNYTVPVAMVNTGNKDHGIPFKGKDKFSGQNRKFADRSIKDYETEGITRLFVYDNSKYTGSGKLKE